MKTPRVLLRWSSLAALLCFLLVPLASAQDVRKEAPKDSADRTVVIEMDDGVRRVIVDGEELEGDEADKFLNEWHKREGGHAFRVGPGNHTMKLRRWMDDEGFEMPFGGPDGPNFFFREGKPGEEMIIEDVFRGMGDNVFHREGEKMRSFGSMRVHAEVAKMDMETRRLAMEARQAEGAERERLLQELRTKLEETFARKQALRAEQVSRLREELRTMESRQQEREAARAQIIERRLQELLGERDAYAW